MRKLIFILFIGSIFGQKVCKRVPYHNVLLTDTTEILQFPDPVDPITYNVVVNGSDLNHENMVKDAFNSEYGSDLGNIILSTYTNSLPLTDTLIIRSYAGYQNYISSALSVYDTVLSVMPLGSNSYVELSYTDSITVIVTTGAGWIANQTAYGNALEFWDIDPNCNNCGSPASSFSNGIIAAKLLKIKQGRNCGWWEARYCARMTASNSGVWDKFNGYGRINVTDAINFVGVIPDDPYQ